MLSLTFLLAPGSLAADGCNKMIVAAAEIPHFVESESEGEFVVLLQSAAKRADLALDIRLYPKKRALGLFQMGVVDALMPHSSAGADVASYKSLPILTKRDFAFVRKGGSVPSSVSDLEGLRIGLTAQYAYPKSLTANDEIDFSREPNSDLDNIRMLSAGRLDGSIIEEQSGLRAIAEAGVDNIVYDETSPINELSVWILFAKTECGALHAEKINSAFRAMINDGEWAAIKKADPPNG